MDSLLWALVSMLGAVVGIVKLTDWPSRFRIARACGGGASIAFAMLVFSITPLDGTSLPRVAFWVGLGPLAGFVVAAVLFDYIKSVETAALTAADWQQANWLWFCAFYDREGPSMAPVFWREYQKGGAAREKALRDHLHVLYDRVMAGEIDRPPT
ncbi:MAG TPA: hypothetical protein VG916_04935 [Gemmatimonadaceae bacterium]|nr:hypothetical protein [Gemmatimonadaceae bacterium]